AETIGTGHAQGEPQPLAALHIVASRNRGAELNTDVDVVWADADRFLAGFVRTRGRVRARHRLEPSHQVGLNESFERLRRKLTDGAGICEQLAASINEAVH